MRCKAIANLYIPICIMRTRAVGILIRAHFYRAEGLEVCLLHASRYSQSTKPAGIWVLGVIIRANAVTQKGIPLPKCTQTLDFIMGLVFNFFIYENGLQDQCWYSAKRLFTRQCNSIEAL